MVTAVPRPVAAQGPEVCALFAPADVVENDWFGSSAGIDGNTAVITSWIAEEDNGPVNAGAAYVYDLVNGSWVEGQKLLPSNPGPAFNFGFSADIDGDIIAIGAWNETVASQSKAGAVYVFERPTPTGTWVETARLVASDADFEDEFGYNLEVDAATSSVIVGAHKDDEGGIDAGAAYVFAKVNGTWVQEAKLLDPNAAPNDRAGNDVAISGDWAVVGHHLDDTGINGPQANAGGALVYQRTASTWGAPIELDGSNPEPIKNRAGYAVDVDGDLLAMTSYHDFIPQRPQGWIFREVNGVWVEEQQIFPYPARSSGDHPDAGANNDDGTHFGRHLELNNGVLAIGSSYDADLDFERGATHYWTQDTNGLWVETAKIDPEGNAKYFHAGIAVALSDSHAVIGAEKGNLNDDGVHEPFQTSDEEIFNSGLACIGELSTILDGSRSPNPFYGVYASIGDAVVTEGPDGSTAQAVVDVTLSQAAADPVTVDVSTVDASATVADSDYTPLVSQTVTFAPGSTSEAVTIDITGDYNDEADETFQVVLSNAITGILFEDGVGQVTILDDDDLELSVADATIVEGDAGTTSVLVDVSLPYPTPIAVNADLATIDDTAIAGSDYQAFTGNVSFAVGDQTTQVSIDIIGDSLIESDELFLLEVLSSSVGLGIADGTGEITITDDDANEVSISDGSVAEGPAGSDATVTLDVTLLEPAATAVDVTVSATDGTATLSDGDYQAASQQVSFAVGESIQQVSFTVTGDDVAEADEVFVAQISNPTGGVTIADGSGDITIVNDDSVSVSVADASVLEGAAGSAAAVAVEVTLSAPAATPVSVVVDTQDGTATTADSDYTAIVGQTVSFAAGQDTQTVLIDVTGDDTVEPNEAFTLVASSPSTGLTIADGTGDIDIIDDDSISVVVSDETVTEGADATTGTVSVTVSLTQPAAGPVDVTIDTADGTATAGSDYVASSQVVSFLAGESSKLVTIDITGDDTPEADETFLVQASNATGGAGIADGTGEVTIINDDSVSVSIADGSAAEGDAGSSALVLDVTLDQPAVAPVTVEVSTVDGSATTADSDYVAITSQVVTFAAGQSAKQISIAITGDVQFETDETFTVNLANPSAGLVIVDGTATATISNDDSISVSVSDATVAEGDSGTSTVSVDLTLSEPADAVLTVVVDTVDGTAIAGSDYVAPGPQTITFQPTEQTQSVDFTVNGDTTVELNERFSVVASAPTGGLTLGDATGVVTINNDDGIPPVTVSISDVQVVEGTDLTAEVPVTLSTAAVVPITLSVSTADGTAIAGSDYQAIVDQQVSFAVGETTKFVSVSLIGDSISEQNETFSLVGSNLIGSNASFADNTGTITIVDPTEVFVSIDDQTVIETNVGAKNLLINFSLNVETFQTVVVQYATVDGTATEADVDYIGETGEVRFAPGVTNLTRGFQYIGDTNIEDDEFFEVHLSDPINAILGQSVATITILDDDTPPPLLTVGDVIVDPEGDDGDTPTATVDLTLSEPATGAASFTLATVDGSAVAGADYVAYNSSVSFIPGQQSATVDITILGDVVPELDETFTVVASDPIGEVAFADDIGDVTIVDDDDALTASVGDLSVAEGDAGNTDATVTVTLSAPAPSPVSVDVSTVDGTADSTSANPDFVAVADQTVNFAIGQQSQTVTIPIVGDVIDEPDEVFEVVASNPVGVVLIDDAIGEVTIVDNDDVQVSVSNIAVSEGNAGSKNAIVTFTLSNPSSVAVRVDYNTVDGTATLADSDYVARTGDVRFPPLATSRSRGFTVIADTAIEPNEIFTVELSNPINATIGTGVGAVTILNDDGGSNAVTVSDASVVEGNSGTTTVDVEISLTDPAAQPFTIDVTTANGTALAADSDYTPIISPQTVSFAQGDQTQTVQLTVVGDTSPEANETFALVASNSSDGSVSFADNIGQITIENDDLIDVSISDTTVSEGAAASTVDATVSVSLSQPAIGTMTVDVATLDGSATVGDADYVATSQTLTFDDGEQTKDVVVVVNGDDEFEIDESFNVVVVGTVSTGLNVLDGAGEVIITNDDTIVGPLSVLIGGVTVTEPDSGSNIDALIDVTLTEPATAAVSVDINSVDGTATVLDSDYTAFSQTVSFAIGEQTQQIAVQIIGDDVAEFDEGFTVVASNPSAGLVILDGTGEITVLDNDSAPPVDLTVGDVSILEGDAGTTTATVTLSLSQPPIFPVSVDVSTADGTATVADADYTAISGQTVTFASGEQIKTVDVDITGDTNNELDEAFTIVASTPVGVLNIVDGTGDITILTDDAITVSVGDVTLEEIDAGFRQAQVAFTLSEPSDIAISVEYITVDGTATVADNDYEARTQQLRFGAGTTTLTRGIKIFGDTQAEANENLTVELSNPVNALIGDGVGEITILDDDTSLIGLSVEDISVAEGDAGTSVATVALTLDSPAVNPMTVDIVTADGVGPDAATAGSDYVAVTPQTVTFAPNDVGATVDITINGDTTVETDEVFTLTASNPSNGLELIKPIGQITIVHDDQPRLSIADVTVTEGNAATSTAAVTVTLDRSPTSEMTVLVSTVDGSATVADSDYVAASETLTFAIGETSKIVNVFVNGDTDFELDEQFSLVASTPSEGLFLEDDTGVITISNDEVSPGLLLLVSDATVTEGNAGTTTTATVDVSLAFPAPVAATVDVASFDGTATTADGDYVALPAQTLNFAAGEQTKQLSLTINGDDVDEPVESFTIVASNPTGGIVIQGQDGTGTVSILNDDIPPGLEVSVGDAAEFEGAAGTVTVSVPVTLNQPSPEPVSVRVNTVDDTATVGDNDYVAVIDQLVTFAANEVNATVDITINGDTNQELDESFNLVASDPLVNSLPSADFTIGDDTGVVTITTDDGVTISVGDVTMTEIDAGYRWAQMTFTLSSAPGANTVVVQYDTVDGTATVADGDYETKSGELRFVNSRTSLTRGFKVFGDLAPEADETFSVELSNVVNATILDGTGTVTVLDDDNTGNGLTVGDVTVDEGDAGIVVASVPLSLDEPALETLTVDVATLDGSATIADSDYSSLAQTVTFAVGEQFKTVDVSIIGDETIESTETLTLEASSPSSGLVILVDTGEITISNDDIPAGLVALSVGDVEVIEGDAGTVTATVPLTLDAAPTDVPVTVTVATVDGTATTADSDYTAVTQDVTFGLGIQSGSIDVVINSDTTPEVDETFTVVATNPTVGLVLADDTGVVTIETDDAVSISAGDVTMTEIDGGSRWAQMTFTLSAPPGLNTFVVDYATADGTATLADGDYQARSGELRFVNNNTTLTRGFRVFGDTNPEFDEVFVVNLSNPQNGVIADGVGEIFILDDDSTNLGLTVGDASISEGDAGTTSVLVDLTLDSPAILPLSVDVTTVDGTATTADGDYTAVTQQVNFGVGDVTQQVSIDIAGDTNIESNEVFTLVASNPSEGMDIDDGIGEITIVSDEILTVNVGDLAVVEGDAPGTTVASVVLTLSEPSAVEATVVVNTVDDTALVADGDYVAITSQLVTFPVGSTTQTVDITVNGDDVIETDETFSLVASSPSAGLSLGDDTGIVTITTDDQPEVFIDDIAVAELNSGYKWAQVRFSLSEPSTETVQIEFTTFDGSATAGEGDFNPRSEIVSFPPGATERFRGIQVLGDTLVEGDELFTVELLNPPVNAVVGDGIGQITIIDND